MHGQPLGLEAVRPVRQVGQRPGAAPGRRASTTSRSCRRWSRSRTSTARRRSCRTPASCCPGFPSMGAWVSLRPGQPDDNLPTFVVLPDSRGFAPTGRPTGAPASCPPRTRARWSAPAPRTRSSTCFRRRTPSIDRPRARRDGLALLEPAEPRPRGRRGRATRGSTRASPLRAGRPAATERPGGARPVERIRRDPSAVRPGRADHRGFRPQLPDRPAAAGARRALRAGLERRRQRLPAPQLGLARRHRPRPRRHGPRAWTGRPPR